LGSAVYPRADSVSTFAAAGTAKHRFLARTQEAGRDVALSGVPAEHRAACEALDTDALPSGQKGSWAVEVTYSLDCATGVAVELGRNLERAYPPVASTVMVGTIDLVAVSADGETAVVVDYKTGSRPVTRAANNPQLLFAAVCAARVLGKSSALAGVCYVAEDGTPRYDWAELDGFALDEAAMRLTTLGQRILSARETKEFTLHLGEHCRYCPALHVCPAQLGMVRQMVLSPRDGLEELSRLFTPEKAAEAYQRIKGVKEAVKRAEAALYAYAATTSFPLGDGYALGMTESTRETVDGGVARDVLASRYGQDIADKAVTYETSKAAIKRALLAQSQFSGEKIGAMERETLDEIRAAGGVVTKTTRAVKEHRPAGLARMTPLLNRSSEPADAGGLFQRTPNDQT
jgi:hypothetical protein